MRAENIHRLKQSDTAAEMSDVVAYTAASAQSAAIPDFVTEVRICCTTDAWITFGANPTASAADGSILLGAFRQEYFRVTPGQKVAAIRNTADGSMSVGFMTR